MKKIIIAAVASLALAGTAMADGPGKPKLNGVIGDFSAAVASQSETSSVAMTGTLGNGGLTAVGTIGGAFNMSGVSVDSDVERDSAGLDLKTYSLGGAGSLTAATPGTIGGTIAGSQGIAAAVGQFEGSFSSSKLRPQLLSRTLN